MAPRKRGANSRRTEEVIEGEETGVVGEPAEERIESKRLRRDNGSKKYIGAHVGIQGN